MPYIEQLPIAVALSADIEHRANRPVPYRARVRWTDPHTGKRRSLSEARASAEEAQEWIDALLAAALRGIDPTRSNQSLADFGNANMPLALRGLEAKTTDPYLAGWRLRVVPSLGHIPVAMISNGAVDRSVYGWIADECGRSTVKNSLAVLVRVMEQAVRDGIIARNPARIVGWQSAYKQAEDELDDPRTLALPDWAALTALAAALVARSHGNFAGWGSVVIFMACTAARIGEASGVRVKDIDPVNWIWTVRRQTTPSPGGLADKGTKGKSGPPRPAHRGSAALDRATPAGRRPRPRRPAVHRPARRTHHHRRPARRHPLGRGRQLPGPRKAAPPQPAPHRADVDGRRRGATACPAAHRRPRLAAHHPALPPPRPTSHRRRRTIAQRPPGRSPRALGPARRDPAGLVETGQCRSNHSRSWSPSKQGLIRGFFLSTVPSWSPSI